MFASFPCLVSGFSGWKGKVQCKLLLHALHLLCANSISQRKSINHLFILLFLFFLFTYEFIYSYLLMNATYALWNSIHILLFLRVALCLMNQSRVPFVWNFEVEGKSLLHGTFLHYTVSRCIHSTYICNLIKTIFINPFTVLELKERNHNHRITCRFITA